MSRQSTSPKKARKPNPACVQAGSGLHSILLCQCVSSNSKSNCLVTTNNHWLSPANDQMPSLEQAMSAVIVFAKESTSTIRSPLSSGLPQLVFLTIVSLKFIHIAATKKTRLIYTNIERLTSAPPAPSPPSPTPHPPNLHQICCGGLGKGWLMTVWTNLEVLCQCHTHVFLPFGRWLPKEHHTTFSEKSRNDQSESRCNVMHPFLIDLVLVRATTRHN